MAISTVVTLGYSVSGGLTEGTATIPTLGYAIGEITVPDTEGVELRSTGGRMHAQASGLQMHANAGGKRMHFAQEND